MPYVLTNGQGFGWCDWQRLGRTYGLIKLISQWGQWLVCSIAAANPTF